MKDNLKKFKHIIILGLIILCALICFAWIGYDTVRQSVGLGHREIINDDYSTLTESIIDENGVMQHITVKENTSFYGVNVNMSTYNRVCFGTVFVDLLDINGNVMASASDDMTTIKDNTFKRFIFGGKNFKSEKDEEYIIHIYTKPQTQEDKIALWKSEKTVDGFENIKENREYKDGTIALQYITKYVTAGMWKYYFTLCFILLIFLVIVYITLFVFKAKTHTVFAVFALIFGFIFAIYTPFKGAPDEYVHIASSYCKSNRIMGIKDSFDGENLLVRECDAEEFTKPINYNAFEIQQMYEGFWKTDGNKTELVPVKAKVAQVFPPLYWAQTIGITIARLLGLGFIPMIIFGRIANLLLYVGLVYLAIKIMPIYKTALAVMALTPIPLQLAGSFSYDTLVIALCFLFIAYVFNCAYKKEKIEIKDIVILSLIAGCIAPSKTVYIVLVGLCFIIPKEKFTNAKKAFTSYLVIVLCALIMWLGYNLGVVKTLTNNTNMNNAPTQITVAQQEISNSAETITETENQSSVEYDMHSDIGENGDNRNYFTFGYILGNIPQTIKLVINTIQENTVLYIQQLFGGIFGEVIVSPVKINWIYTMAIIAIVFLSILQQSDYKLQYKGIRKVWGLIVALAACGLSFLACITWTPINYTTVFGIQGRYFYPVLPLIILFFTNNNIVIKKNIDKILIMSLAIVNVLMVLDGFTIMAVNTKVIY